MLNQREMDIAILEAQESVRQIVEEWMRDYLGARAQRQTSSGGEQVAPAPQSNTGY